jgi:hypothetical protein
MPAEAPRASLGMNAAFALYWARTLDLPQVVIPYRAAGFEKGRNALLKAGIESRGGRRPMTLWWMRGRTFWVGRIGTSGSRSTRHER